MIMLIILFNKYMHRKQLTINTQFFQDHIDGIPDAYLLTGPTIQSPSSRQESDFLKQAPLIASLQLMQRLLTRKIVENIISSWRKLKDNGQKSRIHYYSVERPSNLSYKVQQSRLKRQNLKNTINNKFNKSKIGEIQFSRAKVMQEIVQKLQKAKIKGQYEYEQVKNTIHHKTQAKVITINPIALEFHERKEQTNQQSNRNTHWQQILRNELMQLNRQIQMIRKEMEFTQNQLKMKQNSQDNYKEQLPKRNQYHQNNQNQQTLSNIFLQQTKVMIKMQQKQREINQQKLHAMEKNYQLLKAEFFKHESLKQQSSNSPQLYTDQYVQMLRQLLNQIKSIKLSIIQTKANQKQALQLTHKYQQETIQQLKKSQRQMSNLSRINQFQSIKKQSSKTLTRTIQLQPSTIINNHTTDRFPPNQLNQSIPVFSRPPKEQFYQSTTNRQPYSNAIPSMSLYQPPNNSNDSSTTNLNRQPYHQVYQRIVQHRAPIMNTGSQVKFRFQNELQTGRINHQNSVRVMALPQNDVNYGTNRFQQYGNNMQYRQIKQKSTFCGEQSCCYFQ